MGAKSTPTTGSTENIPTEQETAPGPDGGSTQKRLASRFYQLKTGHAQQADICIRSKVDQPWERPVPDLPAVCR